MHYRTDGSGAVAPTVLTAGERVKLDTDRQWWTVKATTEPIQLAGYDHG